jgi:hypothetical protein
MTLPHPTDDSDARLPDPELNPLLNPLLAAHMGRWAEVYFTAPPEKREQAVAELIRELENNLAAEPVLVARIHSEKAIEAVPAQEMRRTPEPPEMSGSAQHLHTCSACSYENSTRQNFCGMCGSPLQLLSDSEAPQHGQHTPAEEICREAESTISHETGERFREAVFSSAASEEDSEIENSRWTQRENDLPSFAMEPEPVPYRYRLYVGVVLAVLLVLLVYMSWRGTKAISGTSGPEATPSRVIPAAPVPATRAEQPPPPSPARTERADSATSAPPGQKPAQPPPRNRPTSEARPASRIVTKAASSSQIAPEQTGAEEMATAAKYLSGTEGMPRDSREAASWLWKAVGKGNPAATMALSDLYLRGDGVAKSCDQARLLLDAAARKGQHAAAERIRNLQAFGCQ